MAAVALTATGAMAQAYAQSIVDGMDGTNVGMIQMTMAHRTCIVS